MIVYLLICFIHLYLCICKYVMREYTYAGVYGHTCTCHGCPRGLRMSISGEQWLYV